MKQAGHEWCNEFSKRIQELGYEKSTSSNCLFFRRKTKTVLIVYIDDMIVFSKEPIELQEAVKEITSIFDVVDLGSTKKILGVNIDENDGKIYLHQKDSIMALIQKFDSYKPKMSNLPITKIDDLFIDDDNDGDDEDVKETPYRSLLGSLAFIASRTRPDITFAVNVFARFQQNPKVKHWKGLLRVLGYLQYTNDYRLLMSGAKDTIIHSYADANFAANPKTRRSTSGAIHYIDCIPILWESSQQPNVSLSTMEAEFIALAEATRDSIWLKRVRDEVLKAMGIQYNKDSILYCDNTAAITFSDTECENKRSRHIDVKYKFVREQVMSGNFILRYIETKSNMADLFTKQQGKQRMKMYRDFLLP